jgi:hypothetical protein
VRGLILVSAALLTLAAGCKKQSADNAAGSAAGSPVTGSAGSAATPGSVAAPGSGSSAAAGSADSAAGSGAAAVAAAGSDSGSAAAAAAGSAGSANEAMAHHAGMCPSTVLGATTKEAVKGKAVVVTIESTDPDAITAIKKRTDKLLAEKKTASARGMAHDQKGAHGGAVGLCPVYLPDGAKATAKHNAKGVVVTITPKDKPDELAKDIDGRITRAADWVASNIKPGDKGNQGGDGGGKGDHGMNHSGSGDAKGQERNKDGTGGGKGTGGGGGKGTGGGSGSGGKG